MKINLLASKLDLSNKGLTEIPEEIFKCKNLKKLNLSHNQIKDIPREFGRLKYLKSLDLSHNEISNLWSKFFDLTNLEVLILNHNKLRALPQQLEKLCKLKKLGLSENHFEVIPKILLSLKNLQFLDISNNKLSQFPFEILSLIELKGLWLGKNQFVEFLAEDIKSKLTKLKYLYCFGAVSDSIINLNNDYSTLQSQKGNAINQLELMTFNNNKDILKNQPKLNRTNSTDIFICYAHKDVDYKNEIEIALESMKFEGLAIDFWSDKRIEPSDEWLAKIEAALNKASIAILIVSNYFLASKFIRHKELPTLLEKAQKEGCRIFTIIARTCRFKEESKLEKYQAVNAPEKPLNALTPYEQDIVYYNLTKAIEKYLSYKEAI